ncbi:MAG: TlyA family RNA methyltransferase [Clostridia bacterium]|nr:TlyA family RNA methyltransferase [Clostridia bacterium]
MKNKYRLDKYLTENMNIQSGEKSRALIMEGKVFVNGNKALKAGMSVSVEDKIEIRGETLKYVSRGGLKLEKAIDSFKIDLTDKICMDIGASTGGFTDCMLQNGAKKVYSIDVGYGQLDWSLRNNEKVVVLERQNFRYLTKEQCKDEIDFASVDVSFISLKIIIPVLMNFLKDGGHTVCLIKPQFEAGRDKVGKNGVVRDSNTHIEVIKQIYDFCQKSGLAVLGLEYSPIKGPKGNIEYLIYLKKGIENQIIDFDIEKIVKNSHKELQR